MKLELKHLTNYLPYKLKIYTPFGFRPNGKESTGVSRVVYLTGDLYADIENNTFQGAVFKPILRPLSDLTKPCLEGGKVPLTELLKKSGFKTEIIKWKDQLEYLRLYQDIDLIDFLTSQWLFENHFDIYNLIQNGLAIDINTINEDK